VDPAFDVYVFTSDSFDGEMVASNEGPLEWHAVDALPLEQMWPDDTYWLQHVLAGHRLTATFRLSEDMTRVTEQDVRVGPREEIEFRRLRRDEISRVWEIERREFVANIYRLRDGELVLEPHNFDIQSWAPGQVEEDTPMLLDCVDRGGTAWGVFVDSGIVGAVVLENKPIGTKKDTLQLKWLHVGHDERGRGIGGTLFNRAARQASTLGARKLYISATRSENTVNFYRRLGCVLATEVDSELFALEPVDIHLEYVIS
jgi:predicted N-acetyltransferase YhbS